MKIKYTALFYAHHFNIRKLGTALQKPLIIVILVCASSLFHSAGQGVHDPAKDGIRILAIGSSYTHDTMFYMFDLLKQLGVDQNKIKLSCIYRPGGTLAGHADNLTNPAICFNFNANGGHPGEDTQYSIERVLQWGWDMVILQQHSDEAGFPATYNSALETLIRCVKSIAPDVKLGWHMLWAYDAHPDHYGYPHIYPNQQEMYAQICSATQEKIVSNANFDFVIPSGTAIQNARKYYGNTLSYDGHHLDKIGCYITAAMWIKTITGYDISALTTPYSMDIWPLTPRYTVTKEHLEKIVQAVNGADIIPFATSHQVSFVIDDNVYAEQYAADGTVAVPPQIPDKEGYNFAGWFLDNGEPYVNAPIGDDLILTARWERKTLTALFIVDGEEYDLQTVDYGAKADKPADPQKYGSTFLGWFPDGEDTIFDFDTEIKTDLRLTAKWGTNMHKLTFMVDGQEYRTLFVAYGEKANAPDEPYREGYSFVGWFLDGDDEPFDFAATVIMQDLTLTAKWEKTVVTITVTVTFRVDGNDYGEPQLIIYGETASEPKAPEKDCHAFLFWFRDDDNEKFDFASEIKENMILTAKWERSVYEVTFIVDDEEFRVRTVNCGDIVYEPEMPVKTGFIFLGWFADDTKYEFANPVTRNIRLTAKWQARTFIVSFVFNDGVTPYIQAEILAGNRVGKPREPSRIGYRFVGWFLDDKEYDFNAPVFANLLLNAQWSVFTGWEDTFAPNLKVYPNPFADILHIEGAAECIVQVIAENGAIVYTQKIENHIATVRLPQLPKGIYFFRIEQDKQVKTLKVVKD